MYTEPMDLMHAMLEDFAGARSRIWLEDFIYRDDAVAGEIADVLGRQAAAGVDVRVIYDSAGGLLTRAGYFDRLREHGVKVFAFHSPWRLLPKLHFRRLDIRTHRRLTVVDDAIGYFGGMNIGDFGGPGSKRPRRSERSAVEAGWPDVHLRISGGPPTEFAGAFQRLWHKSNGESSGEDSPWQLDSFLSRGDEDGIDYFDSDPRGLGRSPEEVLVPLIQSARRSITMLIAYFIPQGAVLEALYAAAARGVRVRVAVPADSDVKVVQFAARHMYADLIRGGIEVFERQARMLHAKAVIVDSRCCMVGSCNIDPRSLWINLEFFAVLRSRELGEALERFAEQQFAESEQITLEKATQRPWWQRFVDVLAYLFRSRL